MQPIPIVACFVEFLLLFSSSAAEIHVQSDLNLEIDLGNLRLSIYLPLYIPWLNWQGVLGRSSDAIWSTSQLIWWHFLNIGSQDGFVPFQINSATVIIH